MIADKYEGSFFEKYWRISRNEEFEVLSEIQIQSLRAFTKKPTVKLLVNSGTFVSKRDVSILASDSTHWFSLSTVLKKCSDSIQVSGYLKGF